MRAALAALLGLAGLLVAGIRFLGGGALRSAAFPPGTSGAAAARSAPALGALDRDETLATAPDELAPAPDPVELAPEHEAERPSPREAALLFRVIDARTAQPLTSFEVRLGQRFLRPLLDETGRIRHHFPDGKVRFGGLIEARAGENVELSVAARGYQELRVPGLYAPPGRELDLGALRLERAPRIAVRVLDDLTGEPVTGARVALLAQGAALEPDHRPVSTAALDPSRARTDRDGRVLLGGRPGERVTLSVRHPDYAAHLAELFLPLSEEHEESVRLRAPARD